MKVLLFGVLAEVTGKKELDMASGNLADLQHQIQETYPRLADHSFRFAVNQVLVDDAILKENDEVALLPPFAGG